MEPNNQNRQYMNDRRQMGTTFNNNFQNKNQKYIDKQKKPGSLNNTASNSFQQNKNSLNNSNNPNNNYFQKNVKDLSMFLIVLGKLLY